MNQQIQALLKKHFLVWWRDTKIRPILNDVFLPIMLIAILLWFRNQHSISSNFI